MAAAIMSARVGVEARLVVMSVRVSLRRGSVYPPPPVFFTLAATNPPDSPDNSIPLK
jgi:hypothetical protein